MSWNSITPAWMLDPKFADCYGQERHDPNHRWVEIDAKGPPWMMRCVRCQAERAEDFADGPECGENEHN